MDAKVTLQYLTPGAEPSHRTLLWELTVTVGDLLIGFTAEDCPAKFCHLLAQAVFYRCADHTVFCAFFLAKSQLEEGG